MSMWKKRECGCIYWKDFWTDELSCVDVISGHDSGRISDKYNRTGGSAWQSVERRGEMAAIVAGDTGIGIPAQHQARVFERFYRVDKSRSKQTGGTGLGLSIVRHIVEFHQGGVTLQSQEGKGTEITVLLPIKQPEKGERQTKARE